jgi:streptogramin lyase
VNDQTGDQVGRMTIDGTVTDELPIATSDLECSPTGITAGPDGNVWFTCELADQIGRIAVPKPAPPAPAPAPAAVTAEPRFTG